MKKKDVVILFNGLNSVGNIVGKKFGYSISRNLNLLKSTKEDIDKELDILIESFGVFNEAKKAKEISLTNEEYKKLMDEDVEVQTYDIKLEEVPETLTAGQLNGIYPIIVE